MFVATHFIKIYALFIIQSVDLGVQGVCDKAQSPTPTTATLRLQKKLLCGYNRQTKPVKVYSNTTNVKLDVRVMFVNFNDQGNSLEIHSWTRMGWKDEFLTWESKDNDEIEMMPIRPSLIWTPDLSLHTPSSMGGSYLKIATRRCWLKSTGNVMCAIPAVYSAHCFADISLWPFDSHNCSMRVGSWTSYEDELNITLIGSGVYYEPAYGFSQGGDWTLMKAVVTMEKYPPHENRTIPYAKYSFLLKRNSGVFAATVFVPSIVMAVMTIAIFCLDCKSAERMGVMCLNIICHCLYMQYLGVNLPANAGMVPVILVLFRDSLMMVIASMVITLLVRRVEAIRSTPPDFIVVTVRTALILPFGQLFFFGNLDPKMVAGIRDSDESDLMEATLKVNAWTPFALILDRIAFIIYSVIFVILFIKFVPDST